MKAIELLKEYRSIDFGCNVEELHNEIDEAIQELEQLNSQCCDNCIYFSNIPTPSKDGYCTNVQNGTYNLEYDTETPFDVNKDFCCNKWKRDNNV